MLSPVIASLLIAAGLLMLGICIKSGIDGFSHRDRVVDVKGLCEREVPANKVTWPIVVKLVGDELPNLYNQVEASNNAVTSFLKQNGVKDAEISINSPQVTDMRADQYASQNAVYRYSVTSAVVVTSSDVDRVRKLIARQSQLMRQGINIVAGDYNYPTLYEYTGLNAIKPEMIAEATKNAREAANKFANDSHSNLGKIKTASQGQFSIEDRDQYTPYIKRIRVVSQISYYLDD